MIPETHPTHTTKSIAPIPQQINSPSLTPLSVADLFVLGGVLILTLLVSQKLIIRLYTRYQLHRFIASLQQMATLERQLYRRLSQAVPEKRLPR
ncbi:MAG: hypothetical protein ACAF41_07130 [Leptolyngbya sp. BL-A-14]